MKSLKTLVMMQLKEKVDLSFLKSKKQTIFKVVFSVLGFGAITAFCYLLLLLSRNLNLFSVIAYIPPSVVTVIFTCMFVISVLSCTVNLMRTLYMAKDNQTLLTYPTRPNIVFMSKLVVFYIYELIKNMSFMIPLFVAYGIISKFAWYYYPWLLFCFLFISLLPVLIGALLSFPAMLLHGFFCNYRLLQIFLYVLISAAAVFAVVSLISLIPENIDIIGSWGQLSVKIQDFLKWFSKTFIPFDYMTLMIVGKNSSTGHKAFTSTNFIVLGCLVAAMALIFILDILISRPIFFKMASKPFEYNKKIITKQKRNKKSPRFIAAVKKEILLTLRTPEEISGNLVILIGLPIMIFLLNKIFAAMSTRLLGDYMTMSFNILIMLLVALSSNCTIASLYSNDGRSSYLIKTQPSSYQMLLISKIVFKLFISFLSIVISCIIFGISGKIGVGNSILIILTVLLLNVGHMVWSAELDIMNPRYEEYASMGAENSNPNEKKSTVFAFALSFIFFAISLFLFIENLSVAFIKLFVIALAFAAARIYLFLQKIKIYYKEK